VPWLVLICYESKILLAGAGLVGEKNTIGWMQRTFPILCFSLLTAAHHFPR